MKSKLKFIVPLALLAAGGAYKFALAKPAPKGPEPKVHGIVYVVPKEFQLNLADGGYAKLSVALVVPHDQPVAPEAGGHGAAAAPPEGFGTLEQEALVRDLVVDTLTGIKGEELVDEHGREDLKKKVSKAIAKHTDVKVEEVLFTDLVVQ